MTATNPTNHLATSKFMRRKLWQLPANCFDLLVMTSQSVESMRLLAQKALARVGGGPCRFTGRDADLIYSVTRDFGSRNPLSELFQRDFESRHKAAVARFAGIKTPDQLFMSWVQLLNNESTLRDISSGFWAALTHPCGVDIEAATTYEMGAWALSQMRASASNKAQFATNLQGLVALQSELAERNERLRHTQTMLELERSETIRLRCELNGLTQRLESVQKNALLVAVVTDVKREPIAPKREFLKVNDPIPLEANFMLGNVEQPEKKIAFTPIDVAGKTILCVGGLTRSQPFYRKAVEHAGGKCRFHDGGVEDSVQRLPILIESADVVICQTGCINHDAYQRVKKLCQRTGKPCLFIERPSLSLLRKYLSVPKTINFENSLVQNA